MYPLNELGYDDFFASQSICEEKSLFPCRVINVQKSIYKVINENGEFTAKVSGGFSYRCIEGADFPSVGDWVLCHNLEKHSTAIIERILSRKTKLSRSTVGKKSDSQLIACNVDFVFIVQSCNHDFNPQRIDRYVHQVKLGGAIPIVVLSKSDLDISNTIQYDREICHKVSTLNQKGIEPLQTYLQKGKTVVLVGSSGVGKSSLINTLTSANQLTLEIRDGDDKGRHATTSRSLLWSHYGGMIIDTPGMREFGIEGDGGNGVIDEIFEEIKELELQCRYRNCSHKNEPDCAIVNALDSGELDLKRLISYQKLQKEEEYNQSKENMRMAQNSKKRFKSISKMVRQNKKKSGN